MLRPTIALIAVLALLCSACNGSSSDNGTTAELPDSLAGNTDDNTSPDTDDVAVDGADGASQTTGDSEQTDGSAQSTDGADQPDGSAQTTDDSDQPEGANQTSGGNDDQPPLCSSPASDPDGDGWGWENGASCRLPVETDGPIVDNGVEDGLRIMAAGDSITHGVRREYPSASWRLPFTRLMDAAGCRYRMVGSQIANDNHDTFHSAHEGYSSQQANHFLTGHTNGAGTNPGIFDSLVEYTPGLVLLHVGTNDAIQNHDNAGTVTEIDQIVSAVLDSGADVLLANVIPVYAEASIPGIENRIFDLSMRINAYVSQLGNPRVIAIDVHSGFTEQMMFADGIHPNDAGSDHIAQAFNAAFQASGYCSGQQ